MIRMRLCYNFADSDIEKECMPAFGIPRSLPAIALFVTAAGMAQTTGTAPSAVPSTPAVNQAVADPDAFMRQAADAMSLTAPDMKPWHLRATIKQFNPDGSVKREGVFEEWWGGPKRSKTSYTVADSTRVDYLTEAGKYFVGDSNLPGTTDSSAILVLLHPLPSPQVLNMDRFTAKKTKIADHDFTCYVSSPKDSRPQPLFSNSYCFDPALPAIRLMVDSFNRRTTWNNIVSFHGHYLAKKVTFSTPVQDPQMTVEVEQFEPELGIDEAMLAPPPDAKQLPTQKISLAPAIMAGRRTSGDMPSYPLAARTMRVEGTVVLQAVIDQQGAITDLSVISGPTSLQKAALDSVRTWHYQPYLLNGEPVEVHTVVNVVFHP